MCWELAQSQALNSLIDSNQLATKAIDPMPFIMGMEVANVLF